MPPSQEELAAFLRAEQQVHAKMRFYAHAAVFALVNVVLLFVVLFSDSVTGWFLLPFIGWTLGLLLHALGTFTLGGQRMALVRRRMFEQELRREDEQIRTLSEQGPEQG